MSGTKSKNKGKTYERDVANHLTELYGESFTRVPYSGAFVGGQNISRTETLSEGQTRGFKGDIIPPETFPYLVIEAKHYGEFQWHNLALGEPIKQLNEWIKQARESCEAQDKWILFVKISRQGSFALWDPNQWRMEYFNMYPADPENVFTYMEWSRFWYMNNKVFKEQSAKPMIIETVEEENINSELEDTTESNPVS